MFTGSVTFAQDCDAIVSISYDTDHNEISEFSATLASNNYTVTTVSGVTTITPNSGANPIFVNDGAVLTLESDVIFDGCFIFMDVEAQNYWDVNQNPRVEGDDVFNPVSWDHSGDSHLSNSKYPNKAGSVATLNINSNIIWQNSICGGSGSNRENGLDITFEYYILDSIDFEIDYGEEIEYYYKAQLFNQIINDTSLMYGTSHDSLYQVFYNENLNSNIHQLLIIKQNIDTMAFTIADSLVNQFSADNYIEENMQVVLTHWLRLAMDDNEKLDNSDSLELYDIACLSPTEGGEAVMIARIMLNMDMDEDACSSERLFFNINEEHNQSIKVYPNPAQGYIVLEFEEMFSGSIVLYDMSGRKNLEKEVIEQKNVPLDLSQITNGLYIIHTKNIKGHENRSKVVVYE